MSMHSSITTLVFVSVTLQVGK
eukprot:SAG11_NODE_2455_length_3343_cov_2.469482_4_plen_21_part_01